MSLINSTNPHWVYLSFLSFYVHESLDSLHQTKSREKSRLFQWQYCAQPTHLRWYTSSFLFFSLLVQGVIETIKIRKIGYPIRMPFEDFIAK